MSGKSVSVVIVNYGRGEWAELAARSALDQTAAPLEVIVVDNGSEDGSAEMLRDRFGERVTVMELGENLGFAGGNNAGVAAASGEWVALLNNDAEADPRWIERMLAAAGDDPRTGMVACRICLREHRDLLENRSVGFFGDGMSRGLDHYRRDGAAGKGGAGIPSGCAMMIRRSAYDEAGGFDESFFCYSEDTDLFMKVRLLGYGCAEARDAYVFHQGGGGTMGKVSPQKIYYVERNRISILLRYYPWKCIMASPLHTAHRYLLLAREMAWPPARPKPGPEKSGGGLARPLAALFRAYADAAKRAPGDLAARRAMRDRARSPEGMAAYLVKLHALDKGSLARLDP